MATATPVNHQKPEVFRERERESGWNKGRKLATRE